ncbi:MAG: hypothetical protein QS748_02485 [Candidatus Endonucleobacter bathymodioli]|uniref:Uncharacterized protein n=1 Tax=Candidatus Endonucleibacter bathymodioli TaxID=539814 RepID=A0AA90SS74_9GAMM|nr:hypothetical protein [Candidatus Endonucleobacter bathymodioli]
MKPTGKITIVQRSRCINNFVEHQGNKVVIIANGDEIFLNQKDEKRLSQLDQVIAG